MKTRSFVFVLIAVAVLAAAVLVMHGHGGMPAFDLVGTLHGKP
jgi:hypothetical protein